MAFAFRVSSRPIESVVDGRLHRTWEVYETDVTAASVWVIPEVPAHFTITLFEAAITEQPGGGATTIDPELGTADTVDAGVHLGWTTTTIDHLATNVKAAAQIRNEDPIRAFAPTNLLAGRSKAPEGITIPKVVTRITLVEGH